jgi:hypothetical protein
MSFRPGDQGAAPSMPGEIDSLLARRALISEYPRGWLSGVVSGVIHLVFTFDMFSVFRSLAAVLHSYFAARGPTLVWKGRSCVG